MKGCRHSFCESCASKLFLHRHVKCPICRGSLCGVEYAKQQKTPRGHILCVLPLEHSYAGLTLTHDGSLGDVVVTKLESYAAAATAGVKVGDNIMSVNLIPAHTPEMVVSVIEACRESRTECKILLKRRFSASCCRPMYILTTTMQRRLAR